MRVLNQDVDGDEGGKALWDLLDAHEAMTRDVILLLIGTTTLALGLDLAFAEPTPLWIYVAFFSPFLGIYIGSYVLLGRGHLRAATLLVVTGTVLGQLGIGYSVQGHEAQALISLVNLVLVSGFVLGPAAALVTSLIATSSVGAYLILQNTGGLPEPTILTGPKAGNIALSMTLVATGGLVFIAIRHVRNALHYERRALSQIEEALEAEGKATFEMDYRAHLAEELVKISQELIETGPPTKLARALCRTLCDALDLDRSWLVGRGGAVMGRASTRRDASLPQECAGIGSFPITLSAELTTFIPPEAMRMEIAHWTGLGVLDECLIVLVTSEPEVFLVVAGPSQTCNTEAAISFYKATAGLLASGLARTSAEARLRQAQRMDAVGRLSAGLAHDFNNLLMAIMAGTELVKGRLERQLDVSAQLQAVEAATARAASLTQRLMAFTAAEHGPPESVELTELVGGMLRVLERTIEARISLRTDIVDEEVWIRADSVEVERAVMNLVRNARDAIDGQGKVRVSVTRSEATTASGEVEPVAILMVEDDGEGMSAEVERRIFEPFFTTRGEHGGHGLGLSAVYGVAKAAGGRVDVRSRPGEGATFTLSLPLVSPRHKGEASQARPRLSTTRVKRVLVVEDSPDVKELITEVLKEAAYEVVSADDGVEALEVLKADGDIQLVISDVMMPRMDGNVLAKRLEEDYPQLPLILMSGYAPSDRAAGGSVQLQKPFAIDELLALVENIIDERDSAASERSRASASA